MKILATTIIVLAFGIGSASAQTCKAVTSDGKTLSGAAKISFMKKCCEDSAKSADGKMLSGAAKTSYVNKCMKS